MYKILHNSLTDNIKALDKQIGDVNEPIPKETKALVYIISGKKGTGKSSLLLNLLKTPIKKGGLKKYYDNIFLISPTSKGDKKFSKLIKELDEDKKYYEDCNETTLNNIVDQIKEYNDDEENEDKDNIRHAIILDDCIADLPKAMEGSILNKIVSISRHMRTTIILIVQKYIGVNNLIRRNADIISFFRTDNKKEFKSLADDVNTDEGKLRMMYDIAMSDNNPNDFLHINLLSTPVKYYKKFDEIII
jgi:hypothetical protein